MRNRIKNYLSITKKEWNGMVVLVVLIALVIAAPSIYQLFHKDNAINFKDFDKAVAQLDKAEHRDTLIRAQLSGTKMKNPVMFPFNPNNLSAQQWEQLGLSARQADNIKHYQTKGGRFYTKEDVKKMYALTSDDYKRLEPYINIPGSENRPEKVKAGVIIELNRADTAKLMQLKGIGKSFADRIISYRNRLGGFYHKEQLLEIYGLDSLTFAGLKNQVSVDASLIKKININTISINQLRIFPYLRYKQVNAVIEYRAQHGNFNNIGDLKNIVLLDETTINRIKPYLSFK